MLHQADWSQWSRMGEIEEKRPNASNRNGKFIRTCEGERMKRLCSVGSTGTIKSEANVAGENRIDAAICQKYVLLQSALVRVCRAHTTEENPEQR